jgi:hypothetical protein
VCAPLLIRRWPRINASQEVPACLATAWGLHYPAIWTEALWYAAEKHLLTTAKLRIGRYSGPHSIKCQEIISRILMFIALSGPQVDYKLPELLECSLYEINVRLQEMLSMSTGRPEGRTKVGRR